MGHERFNANKYSYTSYLLYAHTHCNSAMLIGDFVLHHALFNAIATITSYIGIHANILYEIPICIFNFYIL